MIKKLFEDKKNILKGYRKESKKMYYIKKTSSMCENDLYPYVNEVYYSYQAFDIVCYTKDLEEACEFENIKDAYKAFKKIPNLTDATNNYVKYIIYEEETGIEILVAKFHKEWKTDYFCNSL